MVYLYLAIAIIAEVVATNALKASDGFTRLVPSRKPTGVGRPDRFLAPQQHARH